MVFRKYDTEVCKIAVEKSNAGQSPHKIREDLMGRTSPRSIRRWKHQHRLFRTLDLIKTRRAPPGPRHRLSRSDLDWILSVVDRNPTIRPITLQNALISRRKKAVSLRTVQRALWQAGLTVKRVTNQARQRRPEDEIAYKLLLSRLDGRQLIFIDESGQLAVEDRAEMMMMIPTFHERHVGRDLATLDDRPPSSPRRFFAASPDCVFLEHSHDRAAYRQHVDESEARRAQRAAAAAPLPADSV
ncbi:hypothetical protein JCM10207_008590, partial [Rhodosporidiobolus poonsookiae]